MRFGEPTDELVRIAGIDQYQNRPLSHEKKVLLVLRDGEWHSGVELNDAVGWRFGDALHRLRARGVNVETGPAKKSDSGAMLHDYRLRPVGAPDALF